MKTRNIVIGIIVVGLILLAGSYVLGQSMGPRLATHWNAEGEADGYGSSFTALYLLPLMAIGFSLLLAAIPSIDPLKVNVEKFRSEYNLFIMGFAGFMYYLHGLTMAWNLGLNFSMNAMLAPAFGLFFILTGMILRKAKRNFFIGIKTPWTLSNDVVWDKTHQLGGKLFIGSGILTLACIIYPLATPFVLLVTAVGSALITMVYSYLEFRKIERSNLVK